MDKELQIRKMTVKNIRNIFIVLLTVTAALIAAVFFNRVAEEIVLSSGLLIPRYATTDDKTVTKDVTVTKKGRSLVLARNGKKIWQIPRNVKVQDFLLADLDGDDTEELLVLCWKRGRYGKRRPTWVKRDETGYSQHIFVYRISPDGADPMWMASDIGPEALFWDFHDDILFITETDGDVTKWKWGSWGFEKM